MQKPKCRLLHAKRPALINDHQTSLLRNVKK